MEIKIYTNQGCGYCKKAKELCERAGLEYTEYRLNKDITYEEFKELFPTQTSFPQMVVDEQSIGCLLYTSPSPRDQRGSRMPSSA